jgi:hypothetical protein
MLLAFGFGEEQVYLDAGHPARGIRFWDSDPFGQPGLGTGLTQPSVLISGGGDGALIDFLRIVTNDLNAAEVYWNCIDQTLSETERILLEARVFIAQDWAARSFAWGRRQHDHEPLQYLHGAMEEIVSDLFASPHGHLIEDAIRQILRDPLPTSWSATRVRPSCTPGRGSRTFAVWEDTNVPDQLRAAWVRNTRSMSVPLAEYAAASNRLWDWLTSSRPMC